MFLYAQKRGLKQVKQRWPCTLWLWSSYIEDLLCVVHMVIVWPPGLQCLVAVFDSSIESFTNAQISVSGEAIESYAREPLHRDHAGVKLLGNHENSSNTYPSIQLSKNIDIDDAQFVPWYLGMQYHQWNPKDKMDAPSILETGWELVVDLSAGYRSRSCTLLSSGIPFVLLAGRLWELCRDHWKCNVKNTTAKIPKTISVGEARPAARG